MTATQAKTPMSGDELTAYTTAVLHGIGAPATAWTLEWMERWAASEGTLAGYNPLASERPMPGHDSIFNSAGVRNYDSAQTGIDATIATLRLSYYKPIVKALRTQRVSNLRGILKAYQTWAGVNAPEGYAIARDLKGGWTPNGARTKQAEVISAPAKPVVSAPAVRKGARDTVLATTPVLVALISAWTGTDWTTAVADWEAHHWASAVGAVLATPFALAVWRMVRSRLSA